MSDAAFKCWRYADATTFFTNGNERCPLGCNGAVDCYGYNHSKLRHYPVKQGTPSGKSSAGFAV
jgi:hypothetical protein